MEKLTEKNEKNEIKRKHTLNLAEKITITGVENIITVADKTVELALSGRTLTLYGLGFSPLHLDVQEGVMLLAGEVYSLKYSGKGEKESLVRRMFK